MMNGNYTRKLDELGRLLSDPNLTLQPDRIWTLLDEVIRAGCADRTPARGAHVN